MAPGMAQTETDLVLNAIYVQVMDVFSDEVPSQLRCPDLESKLSHGELSVREFVEALASSDSYRDRFYTPYPSAKVIEFLFRHLLGRAPATQAEIHQYTKLLADGGLSLTVRTITDSPEYALYFGNDVVPYKRVPSLPVSNTLEADLELVK
jgi:phycobilisome core-membrane linker protein